MKEIWAKFPEKGFCDYFKVSNLGEIVRYKNTCGKKVWGSLKGYNRGVGNTQIDPRCEGIKKSFILPRIVYKVFGACELGRRDQIKHIDGDKYKNEISNLYVERRDDLSK